jgi:hypothetical protein
LPLSKKARVEFICPISQNPLTEDCRRLSRTIFANLRRRDSYQNIKGLYLSADGKTDTDKINLIYADTPFDFDKNFKTLSKYTDDLREAALEVSEEESILIMVHEIYHST